jgi:RNA polymerase primary sigma factor
MSPRPSQHEERRHVKREKKETQREALKRRAEEMVHREVQFIYSSEFEAKGAEKQILKVSTAEVTRTRQVNPPKDVPEHLLHLWQIPLLTPDEERDLFRRMNYLKYRSNVLRSQLNPARSNVEKMDQIDDLLSDAETVRNHIVQANTRLVVSIARRFKSAVDAFDEMISTGNLVLIKATERFDYSRGFRFSTYATHSVQRELYRVSGKGRKRQTTEVSTAPKVLLESVEARDDTQQHAMRDRKVQYVRSLMEKFLPEREMRVVESRFGLNSSGQRMTLREVGEELGLSKERVRQLHLRAIERVQQFAKDDFPDSLA